MLYAVLGALMMLQNALPIGPAPEPVPLPHFPDRMHAYVWRNWSLVPTRRIADVVGATPAQILRMGQSMGLPKPAPIPPSQWDRSYITVIRRNWGLLDYPQLLRLLGWSEARLAYTLREDDFLWVKLGNLKPHCGPLAYSAPDAATRDREREIARWVREAFPHGLGAPSEPLLTFVKQLCSRPAGAVAQPRPSCFSPRFCYSFFALYGDPLLDTKADPYPDGYLAQLARDGVDGVWLQAVLYKLAPFPWDPSLSAHYEERLRNLRALVARARRHGIGIYLYLNEPRAMPVSFFDSHPELKGVTEGDHAALCTSAPEVKRYLTDSVATICRAVPDLAGFFTITASENLTSCWSHYHGEGCPRCASRRPGDAIAEVNRLVSDGIRQAGSRSILIAWDWGWADAWAKEAIDGLPAGARFQSVSEWDLPIKRGGIESRVGEYSVSAVGPGPRALRHWKWAKERGLKTVAKIQAANSWELSAVPYIPALENTARHAANLRAAHVDGLMLGWTLGGYPSPNLEVTAEIGANPRVTPLQAMRIVAERRFGRALAPAVVRAWRAYSAAFAEFPYNIGTLYTGPMQFGPSNLLWPEPTHYSATMVGFPYDDLDSWRAIYPPEVFIAQLRKVSDGFDAATDRLRKARSSDPACAAALRRELDVAEAAAIHFRTSANQSEFVVARRALAAADGPGAICPETQALSRILRDEIRLAERLYAIQSRDSRIGFEATNQYFYVPLDLVEKVICCRYLLEHWLPNKR
jgi:hypothetical protein